MAFYPDELSPIDRIRGLGKQADSLSDIGTLKNRRQWKSLGLGKKDMGMNNFATITEEKEEEISSDGSQGTTSNAGAAGSFVLSPGVVSSKKITFPKPRKYITSRVSDRKEDAPLRDNESPVSLASLGSPVKKSLDLEVDLKGAETYNVTNSSKLNAPDSKQLPKSEKSKEFIPPAQEFIQNYALTETPMESQWNEAFSEGPGFASWPKSSHEKITFSKHDADTSSKGKQKERRKSSGSSKSSAVTDVAKRDAKGGKKKRSSLPKKSPKTKEETASPSAPEKTSGGKGKHKTESGKQLNMKEVVNVYKNLAYGSKEEIKSFVENLSFVKDESKAETDKNLLSMMNLKALENKIKNFAKKSGKIPESSTSQEKKPKAEKLIKKNRKAHIERLARHKVVKVPAVLSTAGQKNAIKSMDADKVSEQKEKRSSLKDKEPWKYVGMESALDKTYFVYPAYPPSVNLKNTARTKKASGKGTGDLVKKKKGSSPKTAAPEPKVKGPPVVVKPNTVAGGGTRSQGRSVSGPAPANKGTYRSSATTVCTVKFRPEVGQKAEESPVGTTDQSLLVYLHGTKAINVKSPYSDKQFSRVKFFRKDERGVPLIKGIGRRAQPKTNQTVSVRNISLPEKLTKLRSLDLLDFDEDIQNITDFLHSQSSPDRQNLEEWQGSKKNEGEWYPKESPKDAEASAYRHHRRQRRATQDLHLHPHPHPHPHTHAHSHLHRHPHRTHFHVHPPHRHNQTGTSRGALSPDSLINEISKNIQHLQYLPDTEDNRKMIGEFFDELDQRIEESRAGDLSFQKLHSSPASDSFARIPILGY